MSKSHSAANYQSFLYDDDESKTNSPLINNNSLINPANYTSNANTANTSINLTQDPSPDAEAFDGFSTVALLPSKWTFSNLRQYFAISLTILSLIFLIPGLTTPILTVKITF